MLEAIAPCDNVEMLLRVFAGEIATRHNKNPVVSHDSIAKPRSVVVSITVFR